MESRLSIIVVQAKNFDLIRGYWPRKEFAAHRDQLEMESRRISWPSHSRKGRNWCLRGISLWLKVPQGLSTGGTTDIVVPETRPVNPAFKASLCKRRKQKIYFPQLFDLFAVHRSPWPELAPYAYRAIFFSRRYSKIVPRRYHFLFVKLQILNR